MERKLNIAMKSKSLTDPSWSIGVILAIALSACAAGTPIPNSNIVVYNHGGGNGVEIRGDLRSEEPLDVGRIVNDEFKGCAFRVTDLRNNIAQNGIWKIQSTIFNKSSGTLNIQYRFSWFDENGIEIDPNTSVWLTNQLYGKESKSVTGVARSSRVSAFKLFVREIEYGR
jgi:hypothetical protein